MRGCLGERTELFSCKCAGVCVNYEEGDREF